MVADRGRRRFIGSAGAAALASCLPAAHVGASTPGQKEKGGGPQKDSSLGRFGFVLHGGAGTIERGKMTPEREKAYRDKLTEALVAGFGVLKDGGPCLDAVVAAITLLEDSPLFNAGKGAVFTNAGTNELDSSIMDGKTLMAGSVAVQAWLGYFNRWRHLAVENVANYWLFVTAHWLLLLLVLYVSPHVL